MSAVPDDPFYDPADPPEGKLASPRDSTSHLIIHEQRDLQGMRMRALGYSWDQVARRLGYPSRQQARARIMDTASQLKLETIDEFRAIEAERLDYLATRLMHVIEYKDYKVTPRGDVARGPDGEFLEDHTTRVNAIAELRRVSESKRRLFGVDMPLKTEISISEKELNADIREVLKQLREVRVTPALEDAVDAEVISDSDDEVPQEPELPQQDG